MNINEPPLVTAARISAVLDKNTEIDPSKRQNTQAMKEFIKDGKNLPNQPHRNVLYAVDGVAGLTSRDGFVEILKGAHSRVPEAKVGYYIVST